MEVPAEAVVPAVLVGAEVSHELSSSTVDVERQKLTGAVGDDLADVTRSDVTGVDDDRDARIRLYAAGES